MYICDVHKGHSEIALMELKSRGKIIQTINNEYAIVDLDNKYIKDIYGFVKSIWKIYDKNELINYIKQNYIIEKNKIKIAFNSMKDIDEIILQLKPYVKIDLENNQYLIQKFSDINKYGILVMRSNSNYLENRNRLGIRSSTLISPRIARVMFNLIQTTEKDFVLDPFCGAGGILLESPVKILGSDIFEKALAKAKLNKIWFRKNYYLIKSDARNISKLIEKFKITKIVTDFPYGLRSKLSGNLKELLEAILNQKLPMCFLIIKDNNIHEIIKKKRKIKFYYDFYVRKNFFRRLYLIE